MEFLKENFLDILLVLVGLTAFIVYFLQEREKRREAAALIYLQINEIQKGIEEISSYIIEGQLNATAFYESLSLIEENYWSKYKHYFVNRIDGKSFESINKLYKYALEIQDQQSLMKNMQKNTFFITQNLMANIESQYLLEGLKDKSNLDLNKLATFLDKTFPQSVTKEEKENVLNLFSQNGKEISSKDWDFFWKKYNQQREELKYTINNKAFDEYIPVQIRMSLEKIIKQYMFLNIDALAGYAKIKKISKL